MTGNCGLPEGVVHTHVEWCYQAGLREGRSWVTPHAYRAEVLINPGTSRERWGTTGDHEDRATLEAAAADAADLISAGLLREQVRVAAVVAIETAR